MKRLCSSSVQYSRRLVRTYFLRGCFWGGAGGGEVGAEFGGVAGGLGGGEGGGLGLEGGELGIVRLVCLGFVFCCCE